MAKNPAATVQALQGQRAQGSPRPVLQLREHAEPLAEPFAELPQIVAPTERLLAPRRPPAPRPQNVEILSRRSLS